MNILGTSWKTTLMGYLFAVVAVGGQWISTGTPLPHKVEGWINYAAAFIIAVLGRYAKDHNVSNAPTPADAQPVPPMVNP